MKPVGKPDAGNPHVRFDERGWETGRRSASAPAPSLDSTDAFLRGPSPKPPAVNEWSGVPFIFAAFGAESETRRDESRRGRHECPRHNNSVRAPCNQDLRALYLRVETMGSYPAWLKSGSLGWVQGCCAMPGAVARSAARHRASVPEALRGLSCEPNRSY
jgi:hypothetical protein